MKNPKPQGVTKKGERSSEISLAAPQALRIFEYDPNEALKKIAGHILTWAKFVGVKEAPDHEDILLLSKFIMDHHKDLTVEMISEAISLFVADKLQARPFHGHYQSFSATFLSPILNAYRIYKSRQIEKQKDREPTKVRNLDVRALDAYNGVVKYIKEEKQLPYFMDWHLVYHYLINIKQIDLSNEEKVRFKEGVKSKIQLELKQQTGKIRPISDIESEYYRDKLENRCRAEYAKHYMAKEYLESPK